MTDLVHTLVVDDEEKVRFFLKETLQRAGHTVVTAASGEEALDRLRETPFDLIMLDLRLGGRVDGLRVLEAVRWRWPQTVVIILTGYGSLESAMAAIREGVDGYLLKPVEPQEVRQAVQEALERRERLACPQEAEEGVLQRGPFSVDLNKHLVTIPVNLRPQRWVSHGVILYDHKTTMTEEDLTPWMNLPNAMKLLPKSYPMTN